MPDVSDDELGWIAPEHVPGFFAVGRLHDGEPRILQFVNQQAPGFELVINDVGLEGVASAADFRSSFVYLRTMESGDGR